MARLLSDPLLALPGRRREFLADEIDESRDLGGEVAAVRIDDVDRHRLLGREIFQERHQLAALDGGRYGEAGQAHDAEALDREPELPVAVGDGDAA